MAAPITESVPLGTPITTDQATRAVLRMLATPILGDIDQDPSPGYTLQRIAKTHENGSTVYEMLSSGEQRLVDIAHSLWHGPGSGGAEINVLGGLDPTLRRKVLMVLAYRYLGRDSLPALEAGTVEFDALFGGRAADARNRAGDRLTADAKAVQR